MNNFLLWMLGFELGSSTKAVHTRNCWAISLVLSFCLFVFITHWFQFVLSQYLWGKGHLPELGNLTSSHSFKRNPDSSFPRRHQHLHNTSITGGPLRIPSCFIVECWPFLVQVLCGQPQLLWVHGRSSPGVSWQHYLILVLLHHWVLCFLPLFQG